MIVNISISNKRAIKIATSHLENNYFLNTLYNEKYNNVTPL